MLVSAAAASVDGEGGEGMVVVSMGFVSSAILVEI